MLNYFRKRARKSLLASLRKKNSKRPLKSFNFQTAKTLGVIMCYNFDVENNALTRLREIIKYNRIEAKMLVYYPQKGLPDNVISSPGKILFSDKETNWLGRPRPKEVQDFINEEFDILIDMSSEECFPLEYIATGSKAAFKVGRVNYPDKPYDFLLMGEEHANDEKFIKDLELYLAKFK